MLWEKLNNHENTVLGMHWSQNGAEENQSWKWIKFSKSNSPAAARVHVSQEDENVVESFQMHEHPDRWGESDGESEPVRNLQTLEWWRGNWLPHETSNFRGGGSEMEPLSSLQEIICLIKDFPPSCSLDQSEVFAPERGWNDQGTLGLQGGRRYDPCLQRKICLIL